MAKIPIATSRRDVLRFAALVGGAIAIPGGLAACSSSTGDKDDPASKESETPRPGGTLTLALLGGGTNESLNPWLRASVLDIGRGWNLWNGLTEYKPGTTREFNMALAESIERGSGSTWIVKIKKGLEFHNAQPITAEDVAWSLNAVMDPKNNGVEAPTLASYYSEGFAKVTAPLEVTITTNFVMGDQNILFEDLGYSFPIMPEGQTDFSEPVGSGPFVYKSFKPGQNSVFTKFANYWDEGKPYFDELVMNSVSDPTARLNALLAGQVDGMDGIPLVSAREYAEDSTQVALFRQESATCIPLLMRVDLEPFKDTRVREALKLLVNREEMVAGALYGFGRVANDVFGEGMPGFDPDLPVVEHDVERAKALLEEAGHQDLSIELSTTDSVPGMVESATIFAEQAKAAGVTVKLKKIPSDQFWYPPGYLSYPFAQTWTGGSFLEASQALLINDSSYNETHQNDPEFDAAIAAAAEAKSPEEVVEILAPVQKKFQKEGGYIIWGYMDMVDALSPSIAGAVPLPYGGYTLANYRFKDMWKRA